MYAEVAAFEEAELTVVIGFRTPKRFCRHSIRNSTAVTRSARNVIFRGVRVRDGSWVPLLSPEAL